MKAFIIKHKNNTYGEKNWLMLATSKKAALQDFQENIQPFCVYGYLKKNVVEVHIQSIDYLSLTLIPKNHKKYRLSDCFEFQIQVNTDYVKFYENMTISEDDKTTKELLKMFKTQHNDFYQSL